MKRNRITIGISLLLMALVIPTDATAVGIRRSLPRSCTTAEEIHYLGVGFNEGSLAVFNTCTFRYQGSGVRVAAAANATGVRGACGGFGGCVFYWGPYPTDLSATISWKNASGTTVWLSRCTVKNGLAATCTDTDAVVRVPIGAKLTCEVYAFSQYARDLNAAAFCSNFDAG